MTGLRSLDRAHGLGPGDHAGWAYDDVSELRAACVDYLADGLDRRERLVYLGGRPRDALVDDLTGLAGRDALLDDGRLSVVTIKEHLDRGGAIDARMQLDARRQMARDAVAAGYSGLRVVGDITEVVVRPDLMDSLVEFELAMHNALSAASITTMCAYDRRRAGERWRQVSALHEIQHAPDEHPSFTLGRTGSALTLAGELDLTSVTDLDVLLGHLARTTSGALTFELPELTFIDVAATRRLARFQRTMAATGRVVFFRKLTPAARRTFRAFAMAEANELT